MIIHLHLAVTSCSTSVALQHHITCSELECLTSPISWLTQVCPRRDVKVTWVHPAKRILNTTQILSSNTSIHLQHRQMLCLDEKPAACSPKLQHLRKPSTVKRKTSRSSHQTGTILQLKIINTRWKRIVTSTCLPSNRACSITKWWSRTRYTRTNRWWSGHALCMETGITTSIHWIWCRHKLMHMPSAVTCTSNIWPRLQNPMRSASITSNKLPSQVVWCMVLTVSTLVECLPCHTIKCTLICSHINFLHPMELTIKNIIMLQQLQDTKSLITLKQIMLLCSTLRLLRHKQSSVLWIKCQTSTRTVKTT